MKEEKERGKKKGGGLTPSPRGLGVERKSVMKKSTRDIEIEIEFDDEGKENGVGPKNGFWETIEKGGGVENGTKIEIGIKKDKEEEKDQKESNKEKEETPPAKVEEKEEKEAAPLETETVLITQVATALSVYSNQLNALGGFIETTKRSGEERDLEWEERLSCVVSSLRCVIEDLNLAQVGLQEKREKGSKWEQDKEYVRKVVIVQCQVLFFLFFLFFVFCFCFFFFVLVSFFFCFVLRGARICCCYIVWVGGSYCCWVMRSGFFFFAVVPLLAFVFCFLVGIQ